MGAANELTTKNLVNRWNNLQLDNDRYFISMENTESSFSGVSSDLPGQMRQHVGEIVADLPDAIERFSRIADEHFPRGLNLNFVNANKITDGAWDLSVEARNSSGELATSHFRFQWSGLCGGNYHLFPLEFLEIENVVPIVVSEDILVRELAIFSFGGMVPGTPLSRE